MMPSVRRPVLDRHLYRLALDPAGRALCQRPVGEACADTAIASRPPEPSATIASVPAGGRRTSPMRRPLSMRSTARPPLLLVGRHNRRTIRCRWRPVPPVRRAPAGVDSSHVRSPVSRSWQAARCDRPAVAASRAPRSHSSMRQPHDPAARELGGHRRPGRRPGGAGQVLEDAGPDPCALHDDPSSRWPSESTPTAVQSGHAAGTPGGGGGEVRARRQRV